MLYYLNPNPITGYNVSNFYTVDNRKSSIKQGKKANKKLQSKVGETQGQNASK